MNIPREISVPLPRDRAGFTERECPRQDCAKLFKVKPGTGLPIKVCTCPYCGHTAESSDFATAQQIEQAKAHAFRVVHDAVLGELQRMVAPLNRSVGGLIKMSATVSGDPPHIPYYRHASVETALICEQCALEYHIFGLFAFCPDCKAHNSLQILNTNLVVAQKLLALANGQDQATVRRSLISALEAAVEHFDGFGRALVSAFSKHAIQSIGSTRISFQNLRGTRTNLQTHFGFDLSAGLTNDEWLKIQRSFAKRHVFAHAAGVVDQDYIDKGLDPSARLGRMMPLDEDEVTFLFSILPVVGERLSQHLQGLANGTPPPPPV